MRYGQASGGLVERPDPEIRERRIAAVLFFATCCSVFAVYLLRWQSGPLLDPTGGAGARALLFTATLMAILLAHELGHYLTAALHGVRLALPWFLPAPVLVGTFGAIIRWSDAPRSRTSLLEMGAMGPLAGMAVIVPVVAVWLVTAEPNDPGAITLSRPLLWWGLAFMLTGRPPPAISTEDPVGFAAWIGALVTAINLLPIGQLDGGHVASALFPEQQRWIGRAVSVVMLVAGLWWPGWAVWVALANLLGGATGQPRDAAPPSERARFVAVAAAGAFVLCVSPVPIG